MQVQTSKAPKVTLKKLPPGTGIVDISPVLYPKAPPYCPVVAGNLGLIILDDIKEVALYVAPETARLGNVLEGADV